MIEQDDHKRLRKRFCLGGPLLTPAARRVNSGGFTLGHYSIEILILVGIFSVRYLPPWFSRARLLFRTTIQLGIVN
jgi:hypothetical protein